MWVCLIDSFLVFDLLCFTVGLGFVVVCIGKLVWLILISFDIWWVCWASDLLCLCEWLGFVDCRLTWIWLHCLCLGVCYFICCWVWICGDLCCCCELPV